MSEHLPKNTLLDTRNTLSSIARSTEYAEEMLDPTVTRSTKISRAALRIVQDRTTETGYISSEVLAHNVVGHLADFMNHLETFKQLKEAGKPKQAYAPHLEKVVEFNHSLRELFDRRQDLTVDSVLRFLIQSQLSINGGEDIEQFEQEMRGTITGMRHEIAFEEQLSLMDGVRYRKPTVKEDMEGCDIFISLNGSKYIPFDVKSNILSVEEKRAKNAEYGEDPRRTVWSGIHSGEFGNKIHAPRSLIMQRSSRLHAAISGAFNGHTMPEKLDIA